MIVGYARTSSAAQVAGLEAQMRELQNTGCEKIFAEQVSSVAERQQIEAALDYVREGDQFTVTKLDRLARSASRSSASIWRSTIGASVLIWWRPTIGPSTSDRSTSNASMTSCTTSMTI